MCAEGRSRSRPAAPPGLFYLTGVVQDLDVGNILIWGGESVLLNLLAKPIASPFFEVDIEVVS